MADNDWEQQVLMNEPVFAALRGAGEDLSDERHVIHGGAGRSYDRDLSFPGGDATDVDLS